MTGSICQRAVDCAALVKSDYRTVEPRIEGVDHSVSLALSIFEYTGYLSLSLGSIAPFCGKFLEVSEGGTHWHASPHHSKSASHTTRKPARQRLGPHWPSQWHSRYSHTIAGTLLHDVFATVRLPRPFLRSCACQQITPKSRAKTHTTNSPLVGPPFRTVRLTLGNITYSLALPYF